MIVRRLRPELLDDWLAFFDGPAFADNAAWSGCYCHFHELAPAIPWEEMTREANRTAMSARISVGEMEGFLAFDQGSVVGWLNAQSRHRLPHCFARMEIEPTAIDCAPYEAASVVCFVIDPARRRQGVARALLRGACESFRARGFRLVEGYPAKDAGDANADHYHGPLSLFLAEGFSVVREGERRAVVRRRFDLA
jgi:ribosomal protein S18 acetylase RimI-like enzyme